MKIVNETSLTYKSIGTIIDRVMASNTGSTMYYGKVDIITLEFGNTKVEVQIRYLKRYVEWRFYEKENK